MANIVDLSARRPHVAVKAKCEACGEEVISVHAAAIRGAALECPKCGAMAMKEISRNVNGETSFLTCACGSDDGMQVVVIHDAQGPIVAGIICTACDNELGVDCGRLVIQ